MRVTNWRLKARDRVEWRTVEREAKVQPGLCAGDDDDYDDSHINVA
jgi:hypothetical protein